MTQTFQMRDAQGNSTGDWVLNVKTGRPLLVSDRAKLEQDIQEDLSIATQPNGFGAGLDALLAQDTDPFTFKLTVQRQVRASILAMQRLQGQFLAAQRPPTEQIATISSLVVTEANLGGGTAKTAYAFQLKVRPVQGTMAAVGGTLLA